MEDTDFITIVCDRPVSDAALDALELKVCLREVGRYDDHTFNLYTLDSEILRIAQEYLTHNHAINSYCGVI